MPSPHGAFSGRWDCLRPVAGCPLSSWSEAPIWNLIATAIASRPRRDAPGRHLGIHPGGKGLNQAVQVALAGARSVFLGRLGRDDFGGDSGRHWLKRGCDGLAAG
jgi:hypothetical protein